MISNARRKGGPVRRLIPDVTSPTCLPPYFPWPKQNPFKAALVAFWLPIQKPACTLSYSDDYLGMYLFNIGEMGQPASAENPLPPPVPAPRITLPYVHAYSTQLVADLDGPELSLVVDYAIARTKYLEVVATGFQNSTLTG